jgi:hypothetical protein
MTVRFFIPNGRSNIAAVSASATASAARSAWPNSPETLPLSSAVRARRAPSQNGASVAAAARAPGTSPADASAASSSRAQAGEVSARLAKACLRGHATTAARWYHRSRVLPQLPM